MAMFLEYKTEEFVYKNLWFKMVAAYCTADENRFSHKNGVIEMKDDGLPKIKSFDSHRKLCNAVKYGAEIAKQGLTTDYLLEEKTFLASLGKELQTKKAKGQARKKMLILFHFHYFASCVSGPYKKVIF